MIQGIVCTHRIYLNSLLLQKHSVQNVHCELYLGGQF